MEWRCCSRLKVLAFNVQTEPLLFYPTVFTKPKPRQAIPFPQRHQAHIYQNNPIYKLSLSKLNRSPLLSFLTIPNLKYLSSPLAVFPPTYHFSPRSLKPPSLLVSLPLLARLKPPLGGDMACGLLEGGDMEVGGERAVDGEVEA